MLFYPQHMSVLPPKNVSISIVFGVHCSRIVLVYYIRLTRRGALYCNL